ncbi:MAG: rhodanese-like domain-containing protein [Deltaproteobacteria bacterium]|nr:rhodanese-like domain-containing protein [Deltaproteobacteria bacterium]
MKALALAAFVALVLMFIMSRVGRTSPTEARQLVEGGARLLDVRTPAEFASGHLPGALNVPVAELQRRISEVGAKDRPVVVYCRSGSRSRWATSLLKEAGFQAVHDLGAMSRW